MSVTQVLESIREHATSEHDKGERFERLVQGALKTDRTYQDRFADVWMWMDWPDRDGESDTGIDLVARNTDGGFTAIQCKFYAADHTLTKGDIDSFFTASGRDPFTDRIIVATTDLWSRHAEQALVGQQIPVMRIGIDDLDAMTVDWSQYDAKHLGAPVQTERKELWPHQVTAHEKVRAGFGESDRGKLIMACGTGKTLTALRIAEEQAGPGKAVLFLTPSIALVSQSLKEWTAESNVPIRPFAVCSDASTGKPIEGENATQFDLPIPPTTSVEALAGAGLSDLPADAMTVVFSTYQSIQVVADVQAATGLVFDLIVCDEAHRTTGMSSADEEDSAFVKVHDNATVPAHRRLYMTATPRIYKPAAKVDAAENDLLLASMDDLETYGPEFHRLGFGEAVERGLLADYKVLILTVEETAISRSFQSLLSSNGELKLPDVAKFIGCLTGLAKLPSASGSGGFTGDEPPMQRAVAFWSGIKESERFAAQFDVVADHYNRQRIANRDPGDPEFRAVSVPTRHVDGTHNIRSRRTDIRWLKETPPEDECRVLTNAKCLTEGVDVPALDAVMFLKPRRSKIDIVQAVGRVMRKPPGKEMGYIILPIAIPEGQDPATALSKNKDYDVVWDVLQALRSHDERFNAYINRIALLSDEPGDDPDGPIEVIDGNPPAAEDDSAESTTDDTDTGVQHALFTFEEWSGAIYTKIVKKVGSRTYWEDWAQEVADIAARHTIRINAILENSSQVTAEFDSFLAGLRANLNDSITADDATSMLSQHLITRPIFEVLFGTDSFVANNPVSQAMQGMVDILDQHSLETETESLDKFYDSVRRRVEGIPQHDAAARQRIIKDLYGHFFAIAFPKVAESLGIVYTPIEVVDFILRATEAALNEHFNGASLSDPGVHVLDPFTGTGTFITRLIQSGLIRPHDLARKYTDEIHANEILLLAYYIAAINIEMTYRQEIEEHALSVQAEAFPGIVLADTFQLGEGGDGTGALDVFPVNNDRASRQQELDIRVIVGNPPYSAGQGSANDDNANLSYASLDGSISTTYATLSTAKNKNSLYDSYIRAIRWASNRVIDSEHGGIVAFVTNGGYIDSNTADGLRLTLADEFHHLYIYNLRGNQRTAGEQSRKEGGKIFGSGSRATVAIMLLIKEPGAVNESGVSIHYRDIGDYLSREQKLSILDDGLRSSDGGVLALSAMEWQDIKPNKHGDWINQRSDDYEAHTLAFSSSEPSIFNLRSNGLQSNRDAWNYNTSRPALEANAARMIQTYNNEVSTFSDAHPPDGRSRRERTELARGFVDKDPTGFKWTDEDYRRVASGEHRSLDDVRIVTAMYRPFHRRFANVGNKLNKRVSQLPFIFPNGDSDNLAIGLFAPGCPAPFTCFMVGEYADLVMCGAGNPMQYLPRYVYDPFSEDIGYASQPSLLGHDIVGGGRRHNVAGHALDEYRVLDEGIGKDDVFFYVYGILHSSDYRAAFTADLKKSLPRIPKVSAAEDFWGFSEAGRSLAALHTGYETVDRWHELVIDHTESFDTVPTDTLRVEKMRYPKVPNVSEPDSKKVDDKTRIIYNEYITVSGIPVRAHDYRLGSRSAVDWILESYRVKTDKASGIVNDPNDWATEHDDPTYIIDLIGRVVTVSMKTLDIVENLPVLDL